MSVYVQHICRHVTEKQWQDTWNANFKGREGYLTGVVFVNTNFSPAIYIPFQPFRWEFDYFNEFALINQELLSMFKTEKYLEFMPKIIQQGSTFVGMHHCQPVELLDNLVSRCPHVSRISMHWYYLSDSVCDYIVRYIPNVVSINFENSIGLSPGGFALLGYLKNLTHLNVSNCDIYEEHLVKILEHCVKLETLNLSGNCGISGAALKHPTVRRLVRLNLKDCWQLVPTSLIEMCVQPLSNLCELICNAGLNDQSLVAIVKSCANLKHLEISFDDFTYSDPNGLKLFSDAGYALIGRLVNLQFLKLSHVGILNDTSLGNMLATCQKLSHLTLNLRHRHKLTDQALNAIVHKCPQLTYFEAVHNHFIGGQCLRELSTLGASLNKVVLRGDEHIRDEEAAALIDTCKRLRSINLDGCPEVGERTFWAAVRRAAVYYNQATQAGSQIPALFFRASMVNTKADRTLVSDNVARFTPNLRIQASDQNRNKAHYDEFNGERVISHQLRETFFPLYWYDYH